MSTVTCHQPHEFGSDPATLHYPAALSAIWASAWTGLIERVGAYFARAETRQHVAAYLKGLLSPIERKNGWQLSEAVGEETPYALQHLLGRATWDADAVRDDLRSYVIEQLGDAQGVLVIDETGFVKKGLHSVGVQRQYSGTAGRIENCQIGVFLAYATSHGRTLIDRDIYLPKSWTDDRARCDQVGVPAEIAFATKPEQAVKMLHRALDAGVPAAWVVGDEVYGNDGALRRWLEARQQPFVLAVSSQHRIWRDLRQIKVSDLLDEMPANAWQRLSAGDGAKGPRVYDWVFVRFAGKPRNWQHAILMRRSVSDPSEIAYYSVFARPQVSLLEIVRAAGSRWSIEECFESAKGEVGLDQYEVRSWTGWYRHITLALWAHAFLTVQRAAAEMPVGKKIRSAPTARRTHPADGARGAPSALVAAMERAT